MSRGADHRRSYDKRVVSKMVGIYCRDNHRQGELCAQCSELLDYVCRRVDSCALGEGKVSCRKCAIHCYCSPYKERVRDVMRFAGPRLLLTHPIMAVRHLVREL